jgi:hypothetical protein
LEKHNDGIQRCLLGYGGASKTAYKEGVGSVKSSDTHANPVSSIAVSVRSKQTSKELRDKERAGSSEKTTTSTAAERYCSPRDLAQDKEKEETNDITPTNVDEASTPLRLADNQTPNFSSDPLDFMARVHDYEFHDKITKDKTCIVKRPAISSNIKWNNKREAFPDLKERFKGHMIQTGMAHCFTREFIAVFMIEGYNALQQFLEYDITPAQLKHDVAVMYGALKSVFRSGKKSKETSQPERKRAQWNRCLVRHAN